MIVTLVIAYLIIGFVVAVIYVRFSFAVNLWERTPPSLIGLTWPIMVVALIAVMVAWAIDSAAEFVARKLP